ncbi:MAG: hypothetical protein IPP47_29050 [Bryobacterales bacterium]|nr:hypothetical protein [Bryobacterales bacterium]
MPLDNTALHGEVVALLALDGAGERPMPLVCAPPSNAEAVRLLSRARPAEWFPAARSPQGALAGLWLYFSCFEQAHAVAQDLHTPEGSYWHGIVHRQEPDDWNAGYWMKRAGAHPIHDTMRQKADELGVFWSPLSFIDFCAQARREPASATGRLALELQKTEWQLLFSWCASVRP